MRGLRSATDDDADLGESRAASTGQAPDQADQGAGRGRAQRTLAIVRTDVQRSGAAVDPAGAVAESATNFQRCTLLVGGIPPTPFAGSRRAEVNGSPVSSRARSPGARVERGGENLMTCEVVHKCYADQIDLVDLANALSPAKDWPTPEELANRERGAEQKTFAYTEGGSTLDEFELLDRHGEAVAAWEEAVNRRRRLQDEVWRATPRRFRARPSDSISSFDWETPKKMERDFVERMKGKRLSRKWRTQLLKMNRRHVSSLYPLVLRRRDPSNSEHCKPYIFLDGERLYCRRMEASRHVSMPREAGQ
jgi:hypothetical protein